MKQSAPWVGHTPGITCSAQVVPQQKALVSHKGDRRFAVAHSAFIAVSSTMRS